jgi:uncharacterized BrkB/YihY/UPF0761 family membrane protein
VSGFRRSQWYFATLSMVNVIYGAMAATIVVLLTLEAAAVILLFGGEVIAEIDRARVGRARTRGAPAPMDDQVRASHPGHAGLRFDRRRRL